jgi:hypothetical protein
MGLTVETAFVLGGYFGATLCGFVIWYLYGPSGEE